MSLWDIHVRTGSKGKRSREGIIIPNFQMKKCTVGFSKLGDIGQCCGGQLGAPDVSFLLILVSHL